ncbi:uncharacterized protein FFUJ_13021 [Fusarium fujikuroi IMI 58289]|uniref:Uncharacterized protein n=1 Tax=Gibberella fujikuroi (strain CBS 195.34 / IMI 58289 / NRRL A-6831) TaxID=1279085 RepID=S0DYD2_GIBF5|nr:uncharacterized protein FFUJ_13021 [Fusarium fujikuroi IMI 58289]CCT67549.1 uncharacterized protein FFUJ_13021 [Fusarium fujikuroi IMI 58289]SCN91928.1 uncharacterized protein FFC1_06612 [Fusarium fujikuroi]
MADSESNTVIGEEQYEEARKNWLDTAKVAQRAKNEAKQKYNETGPGTPFVEWLLRKVGTSLYFQAENSWHFICF